MTTKDKTIKIKKKQGAIMELTKAEFERLYNSMTVKELAEKLGVSKTTVQNIANKLKIKKKGVGSAHRKITIIG